MSITQQDPAVQAEALMKTLGCPCTYLPPRRDEASITAAYHEAAERGRREGFTPLLLVLDQWNNLGQTLDGLEEFRQEMAATPVENGRALLHRRETEAREEWSEDMSSEELEGYLSEVMDGDTSEGEAVTGFLSLKDYGGKQTQPILLAEIPVKNPWEIFAWLPFGGWNECPAPEEQIAVAKYWFEQYGAVPAVMSMDILEYILPAPVPQAKAMEAALEQYFFCPDIVEQGVGTVGRLAGGLAQSTVWFFWWD